MYTVYGNVKNPKSLHSELTQVNVCMPYSLADFQNNVRSLAKCFLVCYG